MEPVTEVETEGAELASAASPRRRPDRVVIAACAGVLALVAIGVLALDDDSSTKHLLERRPGQIRSVEVGPSEEAEDRVTVRAVAAPDGAAPRLAFELCAQEPPGCAPLWIYSLHQDGVAYTADVRLPDGFVSPDGLRYDCRAVDCELRVTTSTFVETHQVIADGVAVPNDEIVLASTGPLVTIRPAVLGDRAPATITVAGATPDAAVDVRMCATTSPLDRCVSIHRDRTDTQGASSFELRLPRRISGTDETPAGVVRTDTDCAVQSCRLLVGAGGEWTETPLDFDAAATASGGEVSFRRPGPFEPHETVMLDGRGFTRVSPTKPSVVRWVLCDEEPTTLASIALLCGSPRTPRAGSIGHDGDVSIPVLVPDPASVHTWGGSEPLSCDECWLVVLDEPFPQLLGVPIEIRPTLP